MLFQPCDIPLTCVSRWSAMICLNAFHVDRMKLLRPAPDMHQGIIEKNQHLSENVRGKAVMDVGAKRSMFSILTAEIGAGMAHAFEPAKSPCGILGRNIEKTPSRIEINKLWDMYTLGVP